MAHERGAKFMQDMRGQEAAAGRVRFAVVVRDTTGSPRRTCSAAKRTFLCCKVQAVAEDACA